MHAETDLVRQVQTAGVSKGLGVLAGEGAHEQSWFPA